MRVRSLDMFDHPYPVELLECLPKRTGELAMSTHSLGNRFTIIASAAYQV